MKELAAAERYARALFEIAHAAHEDHEVEAELISFSEALKASPEIGKVLGNPRFRADEKARVLSKLYQGRRELLARFFYLLFRKNRFHLIHEIAATFKKIADASQGEHLVEVKTAAPIKQDEEWRLVAQLERITGGRILLRKSVDPSLVGGVFVKIGHRVLDGSVRAKLARIGDQLLEVQVA